uniref:Uncharacterized protein n=1 Tax=Myotis myotis TaxID=51298 RepID=A0A7J7UD45_MYOMY|nr:hypothetical protein mMyoMyo1_008789 [Myotis myotis]
MPGLLKSPRAPPLLLSVPRSPGGGCWGFRKMVPTFPARVCTGSYWKRRERGGNAAVESRQSICLPSRRAGSSRRPQVWHPREGSGLADVFSSTFPARFLDHPLHDDPFVLYLVGGFRWATSEDEPDF